MRILSFLLFCLTILCNNASAQLSEYKKLIIGKWQSMDDPKSVEIFTDKGQAISEYNGTNIEAESYSITFDKQGKYYVLTRAGDMQWSIEKLDKNYLELTYLARGNTLRYKKLGGNTTNANILSTGKLMTVVATKTYFHNSPDAKTKRKGYLIKGQNISAGKEQNGFIEAIYVNEKGTKTTGWLKKTDLK